MTFMILFDNVFFLGQPYIYSVPSGGGMMDATKISKGRPYLRYWE